MKTRTPSENAVARVSIAVTSGERLTVRTIAERTGLSVGTVHESLKVLRDRGIVSWEDGQDGTLHSNYTRIAV